MSPRPTSRPQPPGAADHRHPLHPGPGHRGRGPGRAARPAELLGRPGDAADSRRERATSATSRTARATSTCRRSRATTPSDRRCATCCRPSSTARPSRRSRRCSTTRPRGSPTPSSTASPRLIDQAREERSLAMTLFDLLLCIGRYHLAADRSTRSPRPRSSWPPPACASLAAAPRVRGGAPPGLDARPAERARRAGCSRSRCRAGRCRSSRCRQPATPAGRTRCALDAGARSRRRRALRRHRRTSAAPVARAPRRAATQRDPAHRPALRATSRGRPSLLRRLARRRRC